MKTEGQEINLGCVPTFKIRKKQNIQIKPMEQKSSEIDLCVQTNYISELALQIAKERNVVVLKTCLQIL